MQTPFHPPAVPIRRPGAGDGVDLHLVSMVLALHGGTIEVVSREGERSAFNVPLPLGVRSP
jgi:signal transduction histidine kinase